jgi:hypothetical protein
VTSACQHSLGRSAQKRFHEERGRFCGWGTTNPRRLRMRQIVEVAGTLVTAGSRARCSAMVAAPASKPCLASVLRSRTILSSTSMGTARGL